MNKWIKALMDRETTAAIRNLDTPEDDPQKEQIERRARLATEDLKGTDKWKGAFGQRRKR
jgi:hypothetical protein